MALMSAMPWPLPPYWSVQCAVAMAAVSSGTAKRNTLAPCRRGPEERADGSPCCGRVGSRAAAYDLAAAVTTRCMVSPCTAMTCAADRYTADPESATGSAAAARCPDTAALRDDLLHLRSSATTDHRLTASADRGPIPRRLILEIPVSTVAPGCTPVSVIALATSPGGW